MKQHTKSALPFHLQDKLDQIQAPSEPSRLRRWLATLGVIVLLHAALYVVLRITIFDKPVERLVYAKVIPPKPASASASASAAASAAASANATPHPMEPPR